MAANIKETQMAKSEDVPPPDLNISVDKVCYIALKAREFDAKVEPVEPDPGSNPATTASGRSWRTIPTIRRSPNCVPPSMTSTRTKWSI